MQINAKTEASIMNIELASYFLPWINFGYYILLVPFKIKENGKTYYISENIIQRVLCGVLHILLIPSAILEIRGKLVGKVGTNPIIFSQVADRTVTLIYCFTFYFLVWRKRSHCMELFASSDPKRMDRKLNIYSKCFFGSTVFMSLLALATSAKYFKPPFVKFEFEELIRNYVQLARFELGLTSTIEPANSREDLTILCKIGTSLLIILRTYKWVLVDIIAALTALVSFVCLKYCKQFSSLIFNFEKEEALIFESFEVMKDMFKKLNNFNGSLCVLSFCSLISFCDEQIVDIFDAESWRGALLKIYYRMMNSCAMLLAAEAHYKANSFKFWLIQLKRNRPLNVCQCLHHDPENYTMFLVIKGDRFFTITYSFIGTVFSMILTYSIMIIQFRSTNKQ